MKLYGKKIITLAVCIMMGRALTAAAYVMSPAPLNYHQYGYYGYHVPHMIMPYAPSPIHYMPYPHAFFHPFAIPHPPKYRIADFDINTVADERLIMTFPLSTAQRNYLEIRFRVAFNFYRQGKYQEALELFSDRSIYPGNYLFLYWAGMSALRLGDRHRASEFFNTALLHNPYYEPAQREVVFSR